MARSRFRSVRYDLAAAVEVARLADSAGGTIAPDILAPALGYSGTNNGAYLSRVANARLFGVVTGRGSRLELTERGRRILAGVEPDAASARREAFLAVPLFRAVVDGAEQRKGILPDNLALWLVEDFGEVAGKAQTVAEQLLTSAGQAGLLRRTESGNFQLTRSLTNFTSVDKPPSIGLLSPLRLPRGAHSSQGEEVTVAEGGLWLDEEREGGAWRIPPWRRAGVLAAAAVVLVVVAVPIVLVAAGSSPRSVAGHTLGQHPHLGGGAAEHEVLSALSATTDSGSFDFSYAITSTPASSTAPTTTPTTVCNEDKVPVPMGPGSSASGTSALPLAGSNGGGTTNGSTGYSSSASVSPTNGSISGPMTPANGTLPPGFQWKTEEICSAPVVAPNPLVKGGGIINTSPLGMVASANIGSGLDVTVRLNGSDVYEEGTGDTGLAPLAADATSSGTSLPSFAGVTEGTLGSREGAVAMMGMASPTGYLDLIQPAIDAAAQTGEGNVDGVPVTNYQVSNDLDQLAGAAGTSTAESQTISAALALLKAQGYTSNTAEVSIDGAGYIRQVKSTDAFGDGGTVTLEATFSNFGCAGTVLMPGQTGSGVPPTGCTSPDGPTTATTAPATAATTKSTTPASTGSSITTTAVPPSITPTTIESTPPAVPPGSIGSTTTSSTLLPVTPTSSVP